ncbi:DEAD-domain-containing protein [Aureobasidium pullulans]|nr:DEAD-domain-containing protein [Aureobasidium pullulans]
MDRIDDTKEPAEDLAKKAVKKTATDDVKNAKKEKKRKAESEEPAVEEPTPADSPEVDLDTAAPKPFRGLGVIDLICESLAAMGFGLPTPVQLEAAGSLIGVKCAVIVGGMNMVPQAIALGKKPHVIVATPGRLLDHLGNTKGFSLRTLKYLVMDEADRLLDLDFGPILDKILKVLPKERHTYLFSATMSSKVESLQRASLSNPMKVSISSSSYQTVSTLIQSYLFIPHKFKDIYLVYILNEFAGQSTILFTRTVNETQRLAYLLGALGFGAIPLHGQLSQSARLGALSKFRAGSRDILVATDVAARGLDIPSVDLVLNFDLSPDSKTYVHRVGRTARAGKAGRAVSFVTQYDVEVFQRIEKALAKKLPEHDAPRDQVMVFAEKVSEAQRVAVREMKNLHEKAKIGGRGGPRGKGTRDAMDRNEG